MRLLSKGHKSYEVVTKFSLAKAVNKGGIAYAKATFRAVRSLTAEEIPPDSKALRADQGTQQQGWI